MAGKSDEISGGRRLGGIAVRIAMFVALVLALHMVLDWALARAEASAHAEMLTIGLIALLLIVYALLIAVPFVPGIEIGLSLLALRGEEVAPFIYVATVAGLWLAYAAGRYLPLDRLAAVLREISLNRAAEAMQAAQVMTREERVGALRSALPRWIAPLVVEGRYVTLALLLNLPGSGLIGGGGGICLLAGLSRLFTPGPTLLTLALAVAPVPFAVWVLGFDPGDFLSLR